MDGFPKIKPAKNSEKDPAFERNPLPAGVQYSLTDKNKLSFSSQVKP